MMNLEKYRKVWAITAIIIITVMLLASLTPAFANSGPQSEAAQEAADRQRAAMLEARGDIPVGSGIEGLEIFDQERVDAYERNADFPERMAASIIVAPVNAMARIIGLKDLTTLVYNLNSDGSVNTNTNMSSLWGPNERGVIHRLYTQLARLAPFVMILVLVLSGALMMWNLTGQGQEYAKSVFTGLLISSLMLLLAVPFWETLIRLNHAVVNWAYSQLVAEGLEGISFLGMLWNQNTNSILTAVIALFAFFMVGTMNFQYAVRLVVLGILFFMTPVVAAVSILPARRSVLSTWLTEVFSNLFLQAGHAIALMWLILLINASASFWVVIATLLSLNTISTLIRSILGLETQQSGTSRGLGAISGMMGLSALSGVGRLGARMFGKAKGAGADLKNFSTADDIKDASKNTPTASVDSSMTSVTQKPIATSSSTGEISDSSRSSYYNELSATDGSTSTSQSGGYEGATAMASADSDYDPGGNAKSGSRAITQMNSTPSQAAAKGNKAKPFSFNVTKDTAKRLGGTTLKVGGAVAMGTVGGLAAGAMGQSPIVGIGAGAMAGYGAGSVTGKLASKANDKTKSMAGFIQNAKDSGETTYSGMLKSAAKQKLEKSGYYHDSMKYSPKEMAQVGQNLAGKPGAIAGEWIGNINRAQRTTSKGAALQDAQNPAEAAKNYASVTHEQKMERAQQMIQERQERLSQQLPVQKEKWQEEKSHMKLMELSKGKDSAEYKKAVERERQAQIAYEKTNLGYARNKVGQQKLSSREYTTKQLDRHMQAYLTRTKNNTAHHGFA